MKTITGIVARVQDKTAYVEVTSTWMHPIYKKIKKSTTIFACHAPNVVAIGATVSIAPCRPISKTKRFKVVK